MRTLTRTGLLTLTALALGLTACGSDDDPATEVEEAVSSMASAAEDASSMTVEEAEDMASDMAGDISEMASNLEEMQDGGSASITIGDETWEFDGALCAIGEEETGQEGAEFVLSAIGDGVQLYISIDEYGHTVSLNDIENFEDPSVSYEAGGLLGDGAEFIVLDGKNVSGEAGFMDTESGSMDTVDGSFEATCP